MIVYKYNQYISLYPRTIKKKEKKRKNERERKKKEIRLSEIQITLSLAKRYQRSKQNKTVS